MPNDPKPKAERVKEAVEILKQLKEIGIPSNDSGYMLTKQHLDAWIADGETRQEKIPFLRAMRVGHLLLPARQGRAPQFVLKATNELKWKLKNQEKDQEPE
jgi:hypothetical protein